MSLDYIFAQLPGEGPTFGALSVLTIGMFVLIKTRNAWATLICAFGVCWALTIFGIIPIFVSIICSLAVIMGMFAWRLWLRE